MKAELRFQDFVITLCTKNSPLLHYQSGRPWKLHSLTFIHAPEADARNSASCSITQMLTSHYWSITQLDPLRPNDNATMQ
jgi:hypothetical protein